MEGIYNDGEIRRTSLYSLGVGNPVTRPCCHSLALTQPSLSPPIFLPPSILRYLNPKISGAPANVPFTSSFSNTIQLSICQVVRKQEKPALGLTPEPQTGHDASMLVHNLREKCSPRSTGGSADQVTARCAFPPSEGQTPPRTHACTAAGPSNKSRQGSEFLGEGQTAGALEDWAMFSRLEHKIDLGKQEAS